METKPVSRQAVHEKIVEQIKQLIANGSLQPGDSLPPERKLAEIFRVSRNTVREAIRAMSEHNLLETRQGAGTFICKTSEIDMTEVLAAALAQGQKELDEIFSIRLLVEPEIARLAALNRTLADIDAMSAALEQRKAAVEAGYSGKEADLRFHNLLAQTAGNSMLAKLMETLRTALADTRSGGLQSQARQMSSIDAHQGILAAIRTKDSELASSRMRNHIKDIQAIINRKTNQ